MRAQIRAQRSALCAWAEYPGAVAKARCAPRLRPGLRNPLRAPRAGVRSLHHYGTCFPTAASKRKRDGKHQGEQTIEEREGLYIYRNINLTSPSAPLIPPIALPMASSKNYHRRANISGSNIRRGDLNIRHSWPASSEADFESR
jgi:hypothetical protein